MEEDLYAVSEKANESLEALDVFAKAFKEAFPNNDLFKIIFIGPPLETEKGFLSKAITSVGMVKFEPLFKD